MQQSELLQARQAASIPAPSSAGQRCACGGLTGQEGECAACRQRRETSEGGGDRLAGRLKIAAPEGQAEVEANRTAALIVGREDAPAPRQPVMVGMQRLPVRGADTRTAPPAVNEPWRSAGRPLGPATRAFMEPRFGHDFSGVRVHADAEAAGRAQAVQARAYTVGQEIAFAAGEYAPASRQGQALLAHELTHVVQQGHGAGVLQRVPTAMVIRDAPNAKSWKGTNPACGPDFCQPLPSDGMAMDSRQTMWPLYMAAIAYAVSSRVVPLWSRWAYGGSASVVNLTKDFGADFTASPTTARTTLMLLAAVRSKLAASAPAIPPGKSVKLDIPTLIPAEVRSIDDPRSADQMNFNYPNDIPGNIAGGIGKDEAANPVGAQPSSQNDERIARGDLTVFNTGPGLLVTPHLTFTVNDTIDLCPGDCGTAKEQKATVPMSQWEATGISGDVPLTVNFPAPPLLAVPFFVSKTGVPKAPPPTPKKP